MNEELATHRLVLKQGGTGDTVALSALIRDCFSHRPDIRLSVKANFAEEIFKYDDRVFTPGPDTKDVLIDYGSVMTSNPNARYLYCAHAAFRHKTGIVIEPGPAVPSLILSAKERIERPIEEKYGILAAGVKPDMPVKQWPVEYFQEVVQQMTDFQWVQVGQIKDSRFHHHQVWVPGCTNRLGTTSIRELMQLIYHAECVLCLASLSMVIAAAFGTPCVAIGGGRETPWRYHDMGVTYLHTLGQLPCCEKGGCGRCVAMAPHTTSPFPENFVCTLPVLVGQKYVGKCMTLISPTRVIESVQAMTTR